MLVRLFVSTNDFVNVLVPIQEKVSTDIFGKLNILHFKHFNVKIRRLVKITLLFKKKYFLALDFQT